MQRGDTEKKMGQHVGLDPLLQFSVFREVLCPFPQPTSGIRVGGHKPVSLVQGTKLSVREGSEGPPCLLTHLFLPLHGEADRNTGQMTVRTGLRSV